MDCGGERLFSLNFVIDVFRKIVQILQLFFQRSLQPGQIRLADQFPVPALGGCSGSDQHILEPGRHSRFPLSERNRSLHELLRQHFGITTKSQEDEQHELSSVFIVFQGLLLHWLHDGV